MTTVVLAAVAATTVGLGSIYRHVIVAWARRRRQARNDERSLLDWQRRRLL